MDTVLVGSPRGRAGLSRWLGLSAVALSTSSIGFVLFVLVVALPTLSVQLHATTSDLQWIVGAFQLTLAALLLPAGFLGDRYGRKQGILAGTALFGAASLVATQATSAGQLIGLMTVMGLASAVVVPLSLSIVPAMFEQESERRLAVGVWAASNFLTVPLGPLVGGWLLSHFAWSAIFWLNVPFAALGVLGILLFVPESRDPAARRVDLPGTLLAVAGVVSLVYGVIREPIDGWGSANVVTALVAGAVLLAGFLLWERRAREPLVDLGLFARPGFTWSTLALCVAFFALVGGLFVLTPFMEVVQGADVMSTGVRLLPLVAALIVVAMAGDKLTPLLGFKAMLAGGLVVMALGLLVLSRVGVGSGYGLVGVALAIIGAGLGGVLTPAFDAVLVSLPEDQRGVGSALANALSKLSQAIGAVILGSILNATYRGKLPTLPTGLPPAAVQAVQGSVAAAVRLAAQVPGEPGRLLAAGAKAAYVDGLSLVLVVCAGLALATAVIVVFFLPASRPAAAVAEPATGQAEAMKGQPTV